MSGQRKNFRDSITFDTERDGVAQYTVLTGYGISETDRIHLAASGPGTRTVLGMTSTAARELAALLNRAADHDDAQVQAPGATGGES